MVKRGLAGRTDDRINVMLPPRRDTRLSAARPDAVGETSAVLGQDYAASQSSGSQYRRGSVPITVVFPVLDEQENLPEALHSVSWSSEVLVVDSGSSDRTTQIAEQAGARVVQFRYPGTGPKKKAWTLDECTFANEWVFFLDADERVTPALRDQLIAAIGTDEHAGWCVDREFIFMERSLDCFRPNWNLRLFRHDVAAIENVGLNDLAGTGDNEIHEHFQVRGSIGFLSAPLLHNDFRGITAWIARHNKYATWEAHMYRQLREEPIGVRPWQLMNIDPFRRKRVLRRYWVRTPARPVLRFLIWYLGKGGWRDGRVGLIFCALMAFYEFMISLKLHELEARGEINE